MTKQLINQCKQKVADRNGYESWEVMQKDPCLEDSFWVYYEAVLSLLEQEEEWIPIKSYDELPDSHSLSCNTMLWLTWDSGKVCSALSGVVRFNQENGLDGDDYPIAYKLYAEPEPYSPPKS